LLHLQLKTVDEVAEIIKRLPMSLEFNRHLSNGRGCKDVGHLGSRRNQLVEESWGN